MNIKVVVSKIKEFQPSDITFGEIASLYNEAQMLSNDGFDVSFIHGEYIVIKVSKVFDSTGKNWMEVSNMFRDIANYENKGFTVKYE